MNAVEFRTTITNGKIDVPSQYLQGISSDVKIIILYDNTAPALEKPVAYRSKSIKGVLNKYANPELIPLEKEAWGEAVKDKHDIKHFSTGGKIPPVES